jgi:transposase
MVKEDITIATKKIKLKKLNRYHKKFLNLWASHSRYSYNKTINILNETSYVEPIFRNFYKLKKNNNKEIDKEISEKEIINYEESSTFIELVSRKTDYSKLDLRNLITPEIVNSRNKWILETPKEIREKAVFEAHKNYKSALTNLKNGHIKNFTLKFKSKKDKSWTIGIPQRSIKINNKSFSIYVQITNNLKFKLTEELEEINHDCLIHFDGKHYYLCVPTDVKTKKSLNKNFFCGIDPGERKFLTVHCPDENTFTKIGDKASNKIYDLLLLIDSLISKETTEIDKRKKIRYERIINKLRLRIKNLQSELHNKTISYLCNNFENIYIPKLTKKNDIINKKKRKINSKVVRKMIILGHCKFVEKLKTKANEFINVKVNVITEEYTSQRCWSCNTNTKTSKEIYKCKNCKFQIDRDYLGSRNILLKNW